MKQRLRYLLVTGLLLTCLISMPVAAESGSGSSSNSGSGSTNSSSGPKSSGDSSKSATITTTNTTTETEVEKQADKEAKDMTLAQRVEQHKSELKIKLTTAEQTRILTRCAATQGIVKTFDAKIKANVPARITAYQELLDRLTAITTKLKAGGLDTTELEKETAILTTKIATFKADMTRYQTALGDLNGVDCTKDPVGFKAALETARTLRTTLVTETTDIGTYVTKTIKPTLAALRSQLAAKEKAGGNN